MYKQAITLLLLLSFSMVGVAQDLDEIFTGVDTLFVPGSLPGHLSPDGPDATPIVSSSPCNLPQLNYAVAASYGNGRVVAIAHEGLMGNGGINEYDNLLFLKNTIGWLYPGAGNVALKGGWVNAGNSTILRDELVANGYSFGELSGDITNASLADTDILIIGNDWNGRVAYSAAELSAVESHVASGGAILIAGLGWSWPEELSNYPMNQVANLFGISFTTDGIRDPNVNVSGAPKLYNFFPENTGGTLTPYCPSPFLGTNLERGATMRVLKLAVSTTGEFTQQNGGEAATNSLLDAWLEDINDTYGREYCVRFEMIANNDLLVFTDPASDPWGTLPQGSGGCTNAEIILDQQFEVFNTVIGSANYDISHVITGNSFGGGCASGVQRGVSGGLNIPVTRHEMGHQLGQSHTINNTGNNNYETENGAWTIQGGNGHGYAHAVSFQQLAEFLRNNPTIGTMVPTANTAPSVNAGPDVVIPTGTPFTLTGIASDPDPEDNLTYVWDNMNRGTAQRIPLADDTQGALFMRLLPTGSPIRTIPRMSDVVGNINANEQEQLPTQARVLDVRLTVNDNHRITYNGETVNASGTYSDDVRITVANAGPFSVTSQAVANIVYAGGSGQLVTWSVNGTDVAPVNTQEVTISLSTDGGFTYPVVLAERTENDGEATVVLPNISTDQARIKVSAVENIYFDVNTRNFEIQMDPTSITELNGVAVSIYPNPAKEFFQIDMCCRQNYQVAMYDVRGRLLISQANSNRVEVSALPNGVYWVVINDLETQSRATKKISIIRDGK